MLKFLPNVKSKRYRKNVVDSIKHSFYDNISYNYNSIYTIKELYGDDVKELSNVNIDAAFRSAKKVITESSDFKDLETTLNWAKSDLRSGKFYNQDREDSVFEERMENEESEFDKEFGDDDESFDDLDKEAENTDKLSSDIKTGINNASSAVANSVLSSGEYVGGMVRESAKLSYAQISETNRLLKTGMFRIGNDVAAILKFDTTIFKEHMINTEKYYKSVSDLLSKQNQMLEEFMEMQRNLYKYSQKKEEDENKKLQYSDIVENGLPNLSKYKEAIKQNFGDTMIGSFYNMFQELGGFKGILANPLSFISDAVVEGIMGPGLRGALKEANDAVGGIFGTLMNALNKYADENSGPLGMLADIFGIRTYEKKKFDLSKFERGAVPYNGVTDKTIVEVIPAYLRRIESALTGGPERIFNMRTGTWTTIGRLKEVYDRDRDSQLSYATSDFVDSIKPLLQELAPMKNGQLDKEEYIKLQKDLVKILDKITKDNGYYNFSVNPETGELPNGLEKYYGVDKRNLNILATVFRNAPKNVRMLLANQIRTAKDDRTRFMKELESTSWAPERALFNGAYAGTPYSVRDSYSRFGIRKNSLPIEEEPTFFTSFTKTQSDILTVLQHIDLLQGIIASNQGIENSVLNKSVDYVNIINKDSSNKSELFKSFINYNGIFIPRTVLQKDGQVVNKTASDGKSTVTVREHNWNYDSKYPFSVHEASVLGTSRKGLSSNLSAKIGYNEKTSIKTLDESIRGWSREKNMMADMYGDSRIDPNEELKEKYKELKGDGLIEKFSNSKGIYDKYVAVSGFITELRDKPSQFMGNLVRAVNSAIYDLFIDRPTELRDEKGKKITGFFDVLSYYAKHTFTGVKDFVVDNVFKPIGQMFDGTFGTGFGEPLAEILGDSVGDAMKELAEIAGNAIDTVAGDIGKWKGEVSRAAYGQESLDSIIGENDEVKKKITDIFEKIYEEKLFNGKEHDPQLLTPEDIENLIRANYKKKNIGFREFIKKNKEILSSEDADEEEISNVLNNLDILKEKNADEIIKGLGIRSLYMPKSKLNVKTGKVETVDANPIKEEKKESTPTDNKSEEYSNDLSTQGILNFINNGKAYGDKYIKETGLYTLSKGEAVIPSDMNPFNPNRENANRAKDRQTEIEYLRNLRLKGVPIKGSFAEGTEDANKILDKSASESTKKQNNQMTEAEKDAIDTLKNVAPDIFKGAGGGALGGLLLTGPAGIFAGAAIGSGLMLAKRTDAVQNFLYGEKNTNGDRTGGFLNSGFIGKIKNSFSDMRDYGLVGAAAGFVTPLGVIGGALLGASIGFIKNSDKARKFLFGEGKESEEKNFLQRFLSENLPKHLFGTGLGGLIVGGITGFSPVGIVGGMMLGGGLSFLQTSDKFRDLMLGTVDPVTKKRKGGVLGMLKLSMVDPLVEQASKLQDRFYKYMRTEIFDPITRAFDPFKQAIKVGARTLFSSIRDKVAEYFNPARTRLALGAAGRFLGRNAGGVGLGALGAIAISSMTGIPLTYTLAAGSLLGSTKPMRYLGKKAFGLIPKGISGITGAIESAGDAVNRKLIRSGNAENLTAARRLELMEGEDYKYRTLDEYIASADKETVANTLAELEALNGRQRDRRKMLSDAKAKMRDTFNDYGMGMLGKNGANALVNAITSGNVDEASRIINSSNRINPTARRDLLNKVSEMIADYSRKKNLTEGTKNLSKDTIKFFSDIGIDISDPNGLDKVIRNLKSEKEGRNDDNEPNKVTNGLDKLRETAQESNYYLKLIAMSVSGIKPTEKDKADLNKVFGENTAKKILGEVDKRSKDIKSESIDSRLGFEAARASDEIKHDTSPLVRSEIYRNLGSKDGTREGLLTGNEAQEFSDNMRGRYDAYNLILKLSRNGKISAKDLPNISRLSDKELKRAYNFLQYNMNEGYSDKLGKLVSDKYSNKSKYTYNQNAKLFENLRGFNVTADDLEKITKMNKYKAKNLTKVIKELGMRGIYDLSLDDILTYTSSKNSATRAKAQDFYKSGDMEKFSETLSEMGIDAKVSKVPKFYGSNISKTLQMTKQYVTSPVVSIIRTALKGFFKGTKTILMDAGWIFKKLGMTPIKALKLIRKIICNDAYWEGVKKGSKNNAIEVRKMLAQISLKDDPSIDEIIVASSTFVLPLDDIISVFASEVPEIMKNKGIANYVNTKSMEKYISDNTTEDLPKHSDLDDNDVNKYSAKNQKMGDVISIPSNFSNLSDADNNKYSNKNSSSFDNNKSYEYNGEITQIPNNFSNLANADVNKYGKNKSEENSNVNNDKSPSDKQEEKKNKDDKNNKNKPKGPGGIKGVIISFKSLFGNKNRNGKNGEDQMAAIIPEGDVEKSRALVPINAYADGTDSVKSDQVAVLSKGEAVVDKDSNPTNKENKKSTWGKIKGAFNKFNNSDIGKFIKNRTKSGLFSLGNYFSPELMGLGMSAYNLYKFGKNKYDQRKASKQNENGGVSTNDSSNEKVVDTKYGPQVYKKTNKGDYALDDSKQNKDVQQQLDAEVMDRQESKEYLRIIAENTSNMGASSYSDSKNDKDKKSIFDTIKDALSALWPLLVAGGVAAKKLLNKALNKLKKTKIGRAIISARQLLGEKLSKFKDGVTDFAKKGWEKITSKPRQAVSMLKALGLEGIDKFKSELDKITSKAKNFKESALDIFESGKSKVKDTLSGISESVKQKLAQAISTLKDGLKKIASVASKFVSKDLMQKLSKLFTTIIQKASSPQCIKKAASRISRGAVKQSASVLSAIAGPVGLVVVNAAIAGWSFYEGWNNASKYFELKDDEQPSVAQQLISGVSEVIMGYIPVFGWFFDGGDLISFAKMIFGSDLFPKSESKKDGQDITISGRIKSGINSVFESGKNAVIDFGKGLYNTASEFGSNLYNSIKTTITGIWDSITGIPEKIGEKIQELWDEVKQKIWDMTPDSVKSAIDWGSEKLNYVSSGQAWDDFKGWLNKGLDTVTTNGSKTPDQVKKEVDERNNSGKGKYGRGNGFMNPLAFASQNGAYANMSYNAPGDTEKQTVKDSGCGPAAAVNAIKYINGKGLDVGSAAQYALKKGYKEKDGGTEPGFFGDIFRKSGLDSTNVSHNNNAIMDNLNKGNPVVLMGKDETVSSKNPYGPGPHYVTATGTDGRGNIVVQDSESGPNKIYKASNVLNKTSIAIAAKAAKKVRSIKNGMGKLYNKYGRSKYKYGKAVDVPETIWNFLTGKGLGSAVVAGIMGNMYQESRYDPTAENPSSGAYGICQWTESRKAALAQKAQSMGSTMSDLNVQLEYLWDELQGPENEALQQTIACGDNVENCTITFYKKFERGGDDEALYDVRISAATEAFQKQGKGIKTDTTYNGPTASGTRSTAKPSKPSGLYGALDFIASGLDTALSFGMGKLKNKYGKGFDFSVGNVIDEITKNPLGTVEEEAAKSVGAETTEQKESKEADKSKDKEADKNQNKSSAPTTTNSSGVSFDVGGKFATALSPLTSGLKSLTTSFAGAVSPLKNVFTQLSNSPTGKMLADIFGENPFTSLFQPKAKSSSSGSNAGGINPSSTITAGGHSSNPNINKASEYANSRVGGEGHGDTGCTKWVNEYLGVAGLPPIDEWVPNAYLNSKTKSSPYPWKEPSQGSIEGDVAVLDTDGRMDEPDHVVISDGEGGFWGNSSSTDKIVHGNMSQWGAENIWGYIGSGGSATGTSSNVVSGSSTMTLAERRAEAGSTSGGGKYGRGKYGRSVLDKIQSNIDASPEDEIISNSTLSSGINSAINNAISSASTSSQASQPVIVNNNTTQTSNDAKVNQMINLLSSINGYLAVIAKGIGAIANIPVNNTQSTTPQVAVVNSVDPSSVAAAYSSGATDTFDYTDMGNIVRDMLSIARK